MLHYHAWFDLKEGESDVAFADAVAAYMGHLKERQLIAGWRLTRRTLGLGSLLPGLGLMLSGHWAAWLIWMSSVAAGGWTLSLRLAPRSAHELSRPDQQ